MFCGCCTIGLNLWEPFEPCIGLVLHVIFIENFIRTMIISHLPIPSPLIVEFPCSNGNPYSTCI
jgi:hypothetical protein